MNSFIDQICIQRSEILYRNPDTQVLRRRLRFPQTISMSAAARESSTMIDQILETTDVEDMLGLIENFFLLEEPSKVCPRWVSRINIDVNQEMIKKQLEKLKIKLKAHPAKNHNDLDRIRELRNELMVDPQQPWNYAKNNLTFRNRNNYCLYCTLRDRFLNFHQSKFSAMEQDPESTTMVETDRSYKEKVVDLTEYTQRVIGTEELVTDNDRKVVFTLVSEDLLLSLVAFVQMLNKGNVHVVGTCSGKRFFVYEDGEDSLEDYSKYMFALNDKQDVFNHKTIVAIRNKEDTLFIFANPGGYPELYDVEITELFTSIIYDYVVNGIKQEFYDSFYKRLFGFLS